MSWRRSLSFANDEEDLKNDYDNNGGSRYAKDAMRFFKKYIDKICIVNDNVNSNTSIYGINSNKDIVSQEVKNKASKLIKR